MGVAGVAVGILARRVDLDSFEGVTEFFAQAFEAFWGTEGIVGEAHAEDADAFGGALLDDAEIVV